jgi:hypothetical protein
MSNTYPILSKAGAPVNGADEVQRITPTPTIDGGHSHVTFETKTTGEIPWNATKEQVQAAFEALDNVLPGDVVVTGGPLNSAFVEIAFTKNLGGQDRTQITCDVTALTGAGHALTPSTPSAGSEGSFRGAPVGQKLEDTTNSKVYENTGTKWAPVWTAPHVVDTGRTLTEPARTFTDLRDNLDPMRT